jgi:hypothetical protein
MTKDELQEMLEFVAQRQEVFAENMEKAEKRMSQIEKGFVGLFNVVNDTTRIQRELAESQKELQEKHKLLAEAQAHTDDRLNALINVVEKMISRNGN